MTWWREARLHVVTSAIVLTMLVVMLVGGCIKEGTLYSRDDTWVSIGGAVWTKCDSYGNRVYTTSNGIAVVKGC
jgi:hypothetical protein